VYADLSKRCSTIFGTTNVGGTKNSGKVVVWPNPRLPDD
jgi:hypothetical protein